VADPEIRLGVHIMWRDPDIRLGGNLIWFPRSISGLFLRWRGKSL